MSYKPDTTATLRERGLKATRGRAVLLDALMASHEPISAEELHARSRAVDLVTVYRTLQSLVAARLVREVRFKDSTVRYECAEDMRHHHHLVCTRCGTVDDLPDCVLDALESAALRKSKRFASVDEHALEFFGTCVSCAKR